MPGQAILFDGTTDFMTRLAAFDGAVASKTGIYSCWVRIDGGDALTRNIFVSVGEKVRIRINNANRYQTVLRNGNPAAQFRATTTFSAGSGYFHVLQSWDLGNDIVQFYLDDVDVTDQEFPLVDSNIAYTAAQWGVGADFGGNFKFEGAMFDMYFQAGEFLDFSVESNRRKFRTASGNAVELGLNGQLPTGTSPLVYLRGDQTNQAINSGTGGDFVSQGTQVPGETPNPPVSAPPASATLAGEGSLQALAALAVDGGAALEGAGGVQAFGASTIGPIPKATLAGIAGLQGVGLSEGPLASRLPGVGGFQAVATILGAVSEATLAGVGGLSARGSAPQSQNERALVCDPALDSSSPGSGSLPRSWNGL